MDGERIDVDRLDDVGVLADYEENINIVIKDGDFFENTL